MLGKKTLRGGGVNVERGGGWRRNRFKEFYEDFVKWLADFVYILSLIIFTYPNLFAGLGSAFEASNAYI